MSERPTNTAWVITCSNRASAGVYDDRSGKILESALQDWGFTVTRTVVPDGPPVGAALREAVSAGARVVLTTGGTGISPTDRTPEETRAVLDREVPGIPEALRAEGAAGGIPTACLSRGIAGAAGKALIVNLPGSTGGVRDALPLLREVLPHAIAQLDGGDH
ncbi:MogA/MoaB family molybdenum cofactor biosynthesis protein [Flexivirga caeni]|uniref:MogA/MoaB family molybdenum cofactor biosynthesis protein n=1 Tax=Flexivirga caeni TaxID=2294115 RepID=A0A3M9MEB1_9MICO|nr:MogA/MoaB family molybdenum cofactor biosynthesis protein [Flexivirga caeni]RNI23889.1 MogA/MoaB family molybdenum cofactor biosynthesis protein [Flexivirga caeni]